MSCTDMHQKLDNDSEEGPPKKSGDTKPGITLSLNKYRDHLNSWSSDVRPPNPSTGRVV